MRPKLVAVALAGGIVALGAGSAVAASLPSWTTHAATMTSAAGSPQVSATPLTASSSPPVPSSAEPSRAGTPTAAGSPAARARMPHAAGTITYTVKPGDTLSGIAEWFSLHGYGALYAANMSVIGANPNLIIPGEHITISHGVLKLTSTRN